MNHHHNTPTGSGEDVPLTPEELDRLDELIGLSIPSPRRSIRNNVMAEIAAVRAREARRKKMRARFVKYGSAAACFILIVGVVVGILPALDRVSDDSLQTTADTATGREELSSEKAEQPAAYVVKRPTGKYDKSSSRARAAVAAVEPEIQPEEEATTAGEEAVSNEENSTMANTALTDAAPEAVTEEETTASQPAPQMMANMLYAPPSRESKICTIHGDTLHAFSDQLTEYVGESTFREWYYSPEAADECGAPTVMTFVQHFDIPKEVFLPLAEASEVPYDADAIYSNAEN